MKNVTLIVGILTIILLIGSGCGHLDGNNPLGVTGGGADGYGSAGTALGAGGHGDGGQTDTRLLGVWRHDLGGNDYDILTISSGTFGLVEYQNGTPVFTQNGTWYVAGNILYIFSVQGNQSGQYSVSGDGNTLTTDFDGTITWQRVS